MKNENASLEQGKIFLDITTVFSDSKLKPWIKKFETCIKTLTKINVLEKYYNEIDEDCSEKTIWEKWLGHLQIHCRAIQPFPEIVPNEPIVFLANRPLGFLDEICLMSEIKKIRQDVKIIATSPLLLFGAEKDILNADWLSKDSSSLPFYFLDDIKNHLKNNGALVIFTDQTISNDSETTHFSWHSMVKEVLNQTNSINIFISLKNRGNPFFYWCHKHSKQLSALMSIRECLKKRGETIFYSASLEI